MTLLHCEGPACNAGLSAKDRETALTSGAPNVTAELRDEAAKHARSMVSRQLAVTPHVRCGSSSRGQMLFRCTSCAHERVYGGSQWAGW